MKKQTLSMALLGIFLVQRHAPAQVLRALPGMSLLLGFVLLVCVPAAALILMITIIGIPLALVTIALYLALLPVGYASAGIALGAWALQRFKSDRASQRGWRIASALLAVLLLALLGRIPAVGAIVGFASLVAGLGALLLQVIRLLMTPRWLSVSAARCTLSWETTGISRSPRRRIWCWPRRF